jgi:hypothetical protein
MMLSHITVLLALLAFCLGAELTQIQYCADSVYETYGTINFVESSAHDYWGSVCQGPLKLTSIYASATIHCTTEEIDEGFKILAEYCTEYGEIELLPISDFQDNLTTEAIAGYRVIDASDVTPTDNLTAPVVLSNDYFTVALRTIVSLAFKYPLCPNRTNDSVYLGVRNMDAPYLWVGSLSHQISICIDLF